MGNEEANVFKTAPSCGCVSLFCGGHGLGRVAGTGVDSSGDFFGAGRIDCRMNTRISLGKMCVFGIQWRRLTMASKENRPPSKEDRAARLLGVCRLLLPDEHLSTHRRRVAELLGQDDSFLPADKSLAEADAKAAVASFDKRRLLSSALVKCFEQKRYPGLPSAPALGMAFAALIYPREAGRLDPYGQAASEIELFLSDMEKVRMEYIAAQLFPARPVPILISQIARVALWIARDSDRADLRDQESLRKLFGNRGLIPPALAMQLLPASKAAGLDAVALAMCMAACIYPGRAYQMDQDVELPSRVDSFLKLLHFLCNLEAEADDSVDIALEMVAVMVPEAVLMSKEERLALLSDLSAAELALESPQGRASADERITGAALFVATCGAARLGRLLGNWREEACLLRTLRGRIPISPLNLGRSRVGQATPPWDEIQSTLKRQLDIAEDKHAESAIILTRMVFNKAWNLNVPMPEESVEVFWRGQMTKLASGFPYFAFFSRFAYWWKQCIKTHSFFRADESELPDEIENIPVTSGETDPDPETVLSPNLMLVFAEGYRLVRTTFFRREDSRSKEDASADGVDSYPHEHLRRALDALWYERIRRAGDEDAEIKAVNQIASEFPKLGLTTINNLSHKLPLRIQAYYLARGRRMSNIQISALGVKGKKNTEFPFQNATDFLPVTSLAGGVPLHASLFPAFMAHVFLFSKVVPQRPDSWTVERLIFEASYWTRHGALNLDSPPRQNHSAAEAAMWELLKDEKVRQAIQSARNCDSAKALAECIHDLQERGLSRAVTDWLVRSLSAEAIQQASDIAQFRKVSQASHWIIPVWYYTHAEKMTGETIRSRCPLDDSDLSAVKLLHERMNRSQPQGVK